MILKRRFDAQCMFPADSCDEVREELKSKDATIKLLRDALEKINKGTSENWIRVVFSQTLAELDKKGV